MVWLLAVAMVAGAQTEKKRYVEVCGVKWATGNLYYKNGKYGLFEKQYGTFGAKQQTENQVEHFNWGLTSPDYAGNNYLHKYYGPIGGTEYDIATKCLGKEWRLPTEAELEKLEKEADIAYGYVDTKQAQAGEEAEKRCGFPPDDRRRFGPRTVPAVVGGEARQFPVCGGNRKRRLVLERYGEERLCAVAHPALAFQALLVGYGRGSGMQRAARVPGQMTDSLHEKNV